MSVPREIRLELPYQFIVMPKGATDDEYGEMMFVALVATVAADVQAGLVLPEAFGYMTRSNPMSPKSALKLSALCIDRVKEFCLYERFPHVVVGRETNVDKSGKDVVVIRMTRAGR